MSEGVQNKDSVNKRGDSPGWWKKSVSGIICLSLGLSLIGIAKMVMGMTSALTALIAFSIGYLLVYKTNFRKNIADKTTTQKAIASVFVLMFFIASVGLYGAGRELQGEMFSESTNNSPQMDEEPITNNVSQKKDSPSDNYNNDETKTQEKSQDTKNKDEAAFSDFDTKELSEEVEGAQKEVEREVDEMAPVYVMPGVQLYGAEIQDGTVTYQHTVTDQANLSTINKIESERYQQEKQNDFCSREFFAELRSYHLSINYEYYHESGSLMHEFSVSPNNC